MATAIVVALLVIGRLVGSGWLGSWNTRRPAEPPSIERPSQGSDFWALLPSVLWPAVTIIAIVALFLIARQAISSGSNVTIVWKVTERVQGRVVITKVRERAPSKRATA